MGLEPSILFDPEGVWILRAIQHFLPITAVKKTQPLKINDVFPSLLDFHLRDEDTENQKERATINPPAIFFQGFGFSLDVKQC